jgi:hypothetical protein
MSIPAKELESTGRLNNFVLRVITDIFRVIGVYSGFLPKIR